MEWGVLAGVIIGLLAYVNTARGGMITEIKNGFSFDVLMGVILRMIPPAVFLGFLGWLFSW